MDQDFEIMKIFDHHNRGQFIFVRRLKAGADLTVREGSLLEGIPIYHYLDIPKMLDENQQARLDIFVFRPLSRFPAHYFKEGQLVKLVEPD